MFQCQWRRLQSAEALYGAPTPIPTDWVTREGSSCGVTVAPSTCVYRQASTVGRLRRADGTRVRHIRYLRNLDGYYLGLGTQPSSFRLPGPSSTILSPTSNLLPKKSGNLSKKSSRAKHKTSSSRCRKSWLRNMSQGQTSSKMWLAVAHPLLHQTSSICTANPFRMQALT